MWQLVLLYDPRIKNFGGFLGSHSFLCSRYRGEGIVHATPEKVWGCVKPLAGTLRDKWDENVSSFEIIESLTDVSLSERCYPSKSPDPVPLEGVRDTFWQGQDPAQPRFAAGGKPCDQMGGEVLSGAQRNSRRYEGGQHECGL